MNRQQNSGWQGAAQVARARLQTVDQALARLEAVVPNVKDPTPKTDNHTKGDGPSDPKKNALKVIKLHEPKPLPPLSLKALETFLTEPAYHQRYAPKAV